MLGLSIRVEWWCWACSYLLLWCRQLPRSPTLNPLVWVVLRSPLYIDLVQILFMIFFTALEHVLIPKLPPLQKKIEYSKYSDLKWTRCGRVYAIIKRRSKKKLTIRMRIVDQHAYDHFKKILTLINAVQVIFRKFHISAGIPNGIT